MRLPSSGHVDTPEPYSSNPSQAKAHVISIWQVHEFAKQVSKNLHSIGTVGIDSVLLLAAVEIPNTHERTMNSPQATEWEKAMQPELYSLDKDEVADLIAFSSVPAGYATIGKP